MTVSFLANFLIDEGKTIRDALKKITSNKSGHVAVKDGNGCVIGVISDGDVRAWLLSGGSIDDDLKNAYTSSFIWERVGVDRQKLLKHIDNGLKFIPLLDKKLQLKDCITPTSLPALTKAPVFAQSRAPARLGIAGGGSDLSYVFMEQGGAVLNAAISKYAHAQLFIRDDSRIIIKSADLLLSQIFRSIDHLACRKQGLSLIIEAIRFVQPKYGFELLINCDFSTGSGLGGSSAVIVAILGCFNEFRDSPWSRQEIVEAAFEIERLNLGLKGGWQDMYAATFGGVNFIQFSEENNIRTPIGLSTSDLYELEQRLLLCNTAVQHDSSVLHAEQHNHTKSTNMLEIMETHISLCEQAKESVVNNNVDKLGSLLNEVWQLKRQFSPSVSSSEFDGIYDLAIASGAIGGKLLGAGGGGYFLFCVRPQKKYDVIRALKGIGLQVENLQFDTLGLVSKKVRI